MDTLPYAPLLGTLALALLWSALFSAVDAARLMEVYEKAHPRA